MAATFLSGKAGSAGGANVTSWTFTETIDAIDVTHSGASGRRTFISGLQRGEGSFEADVDTTAMYSTSFVPGQQITMVLVLGGSPVKQYSFLAQIVSVAVKSEVAGKVSYTCNFQFTGPTALTRP